MSLSQMPAWRSEFAGTFSFLVHMFPHSSWQVGTILCSAQAPCLCSAKAQAALQRGRGCFLGNQTSENIFPKTCTATGGSLAGPTFPQPPPKGQCGFQTARARVLISEGISIQCQRLHNHVNTGRLESFKANPELSFWRNGKQNKLQWCNWRQNLLSWL